MGKNPFQLKYDPETDILHVAFGKARKAISVEKDPEVFIRIDPATHEVIGFTVLGFKEHFLVHKQNITLAPYL